MKVEYVKLARPEMVYGETSLLQTQLNVLQIKKQHENYKSLRKSELHGKIELKRLISEAKEHLDVVDRFLPHTHALDEKKKEEKIKQEIMTEIEPKAEKKSKSESKVSSIEDELADIQARLAALHK